MRIPLPPAVLLLVATAALPAQAQRTPARNPTTGLAIPPNQDLSRLDLSQPARSRSGQGMRAERAARAARQAQLGHHFPGTPIRSYAAQR